MQGAPMRSEAPSNRRLRRSRLSRTHVGDPLRRLGEARIRILPTSFDPAVGTLAGSAKAGGLCVRSKP